LIRASLIKLKFYFKINLKTSKKININNLSKG